MHSPHLPAAPAALCAAVFLLVTSIAPAQPAATPATAAAPDEKHLTVTLSPSPDARDLAPLFLGLSYEMRILLRGPADRTPVSGSSATAPAPTGAVHAGVGKYYFDATDENLVRIYQTLGIKSLRVGANAVDDPRVTVPDTEEIDALFTFAKKAGAKVIYSFRLKKGDPANAARLAEYIARTYADTLDCFSIGNEPDFYFKAYEPFRDAWKPVYEAILKAVPDAKFDGPATSRRSYALEFADEFFPGGHVSMVSTHTYAMGNGRLAEKDPPAARARFVSNKTLAGYQRLYDGIVKPLEAKKIPYRLDETNSCFAGGAKDCSDAYASSLWVLDYLNWWAAHHIQGLNFHSGDTVNGFPIMTANYAVFVHKPAPPADASKEFDVRPVAYGLLAFSQTAQGKPMNAKIEGAGENLDFTAYAYGPAGSSGSAKDAKSIILLNKTSGSTATPIIVTIAGTGAGSRAGAAAGTTSKTQWQSMTLEQAAGDLAAKTSITLGDSPIDPTGAWSGKWTDLPAADAGEGGAVDDGTLTVTLKPTTAMLLRRAPAR